MRGPHKSTLAEKAIAHFADEAKEKVAPNQARLVLYEKIKGNFPAQMKVSSIAAIPNKLKKNQIDTGPVIFIKSNSTWARSFS